MRYKKYKLNPDMSVSVDGYDLPCPWTTLAHTRVCGRDIKLQFSPYDLNTYHNLPLPWLFAVTLEGETTSAHATYNEALADFYEIVEEVEIESTKPPEIIVAPKLVSLTVPCLVST